MMEIARVEIKNEENERVFNIFRHDGYVGITAESRVVLNIKTKQDVDAFIKDIRNAFKAIGVK